ncbi:Rne/Rng family ribonuclease, partial [Gammaproteobacteria bacterium]|nr:Rne/Rng family ribonuclease [Gammaproteobacteria bacterium]
MPEEILVNITPDEARVALLFNGSLQEVYIERKSLRGLQGNIYKGKISRILPGIQAAFVDIGLNKSAFLHIKDTGADPLLTDIRNLYQVGQELLVQVYKEPLGLKGARLTTKFTVASRYLVLTPNFEQVLVSQKIIDEEERQRLLDMTSSGPDGGYIFRTAAYGVSEADIDKDKLFLSNVWNNILLQAKNTKGGGIVHEEIPIFLRVLRDLSGSNIERIRVDQFDIVQQMRDFSKKYVAALMNKIEYYSDDRPIFDIYSVEDEIQKGLLRKVYLKSGGHLVFDQTEAMTTIDVNTGSYVGHGNIEKTIFKTNLESVDIIARQVRLRNLGGIIIVDFIDMIDSMHKAHLLETLTKALSRDSARIEISEISDLGLVQMTRKRTRESLEHILCVSCPLCQSRGSIKSLETVCYEIIRELKRVSHNYPWTGFLIVANQDIVDCLLEEESAMIAELEAELVRPIKLQVNISYTQEQ